MKTEDQYHQELIQNIAQDYAEILNSSQQAVYIWLDEERMVCNNRFAELLGYDSALEVCSQKGTFLDAFVSEPSQEILAKAYQDAMSKKISSTFPLHWKNEERRNRAGKGKPGPHRIRWSPFCTAFYRLIGVAGFEIGEKVILRGEWNTCAWRWFLEDGISVFLFLIIYGCETMGI